MREKEAAGKEVTQLTVSLKEKEKVDRELDQKLKQTQQDLQLQQKLMKYAQIVNAINSLLYQ